jgi:hypothetical protein
VDAGTAVAEADDPDLRVAVTALATASNPEIEAPQWGLRIAD